MSADFSEEDLKVYKDAFDAADKEQIGRIARDEIVNVIRRLGFNPIPDEITKMTDKATELSPEGGVDFDQFCQVTRILERTPADEKLALSAAFKVFDKSGDGMISRSHLAEVLKTKGADQLTDEEIEGMLAQVTRDGNVAYEELVTLLTT